MTDEQAALLILGSFKRRNTRIGEIEMQGAVYGDFIQPDNRTGAQWNAGLDYGLDQKWWERTGGAALRLLDAGYQKIGDL